jgi:hypothetical protein
LEKLAGIKQKEGAKMSILSLIGILFIILLLMSMLAKARPFSKADLPGKPLKTIRMNLFSRLWVYRFSLAALATGLIFGSLAGWLPLNIAGMVAAFAIVIVLLPMQLTLTTQGMGIGEAMFRSWSEFSGIKTRKSSFQLEQTSVLGQMTIFINQREIGPVAKLIERQLQAQSSKS